ncbi:helix-turn-helix domain-containing protein [Acidovorax sp. NPDC077693]|uniref:helix-turn-helix domain-containing protein n=1 Tax=unclassified Acidovorax TaxID=2684926 RepID=UPI0037CB7B3D
MNDFDSRVLPGSRVMFENAVYRISDFADPERAVLATDDGAYVVAPIASLRPVAGRAARSDDLVSIDRSRWEKAFDVYRHIQDLEAVDKHVMSTELDRKAKFLGVHRSTMYRWIKRYRETGLISSLLRPVRADRGESRLSEEVEAIVSQCIRTHYLTSNRKRVSSLVSEIAKKCSEKGLKAPSSYAITARVRRLEPAMVAEQRFSKKYADERYEPLRGSFPNANYPYAVIQIDHTPMDVIIVDDVHRKPIGRAFLTLAIDVNTKMVAGFVISIDNPGAFATGTCILMSILPKDEWLREKGLPDDLKWPCYGLMRTIHTDNAKEFRGTMMSKACDEYGIVGEQRPRGQPQYGGSIERAFRTFMEKSHEELPGTTFGSVATRFDYDSEGKAVMSFSALERWFTMYLLGVYHQQTHQGNPSSMPPIQMWWKGILEGTETTPPVGQPLPLDPDKAERLRLDFLPYFEATVQQYGVRQWSIDWFSNRLRRFIGSKLSDKKTARKFVCRYDPRDLRKIWFYDDEARSYIELPFRIISRPAVSLWEVRASKRTLISEGRPSTNEALIFKTIDSMRQLVERESEVTKSARRTAQRKKEWEKAQTKSPSQPAKKPAQVEVAPSIEFDEAELLGNIHESDD